MLHRILAIEDDADTLTFYRDFLGDEGYDIITCPTTIADLATVDQMKPDVIILDYLFGSRPDGREMLQHLKARNSTQDIPVILCTAVARAAEKVEPYLSADGIVLLPKPFEIDDLLQAVKQALSEDVAGN